MSNSPCPGVTLRRIPGSDIPVLRIHYSADDSLSAERIASMKAKYTNPQIWAREMEVEYEALEGERVFPEYSPSINDAPPFDCSDPRYWTIWHACDPHGRTPNAFNWVGFGSDGDAFVLGEMWPKRRYSVKECSENIKWLESDSRDKPDNFLPGRSLKVFRRVMDTHGKAINAEDAGEDFFKEFRKNGLSYQPAKKSSQILQVARDRIGRMLTADKVVSAQGISSLPRLYVSLACPETRDEFENVRYASGDIERPSEEMPITYRKHLLDCVIYIFSEGARFVTVKRQADTFVPIYDSTGY